MAKQVLGRNLEALLDTSANRTEKLAVTAPDAAPVGSGVRSLMRGHLASPFDPPQTVAQKKSVIPRWYLFGGDILLTALALIIVCKSPHPLPWPKALFCAVTVTLGACLAVAALGQSDK